MSDDFVYYLTNVIWPAFVDTVIMLAVVLIFSIIIGILLAVALYNTSPIGLRPAPRLNKILGTIVNILRSLPVIVFIILLFPMCRVVIGSAIGMKAGIFYLTLASIPFVARVLEGNLREVDPEIIRAGRSMGLTDAQILWRIVVHGAVPAMVSSLSFCAIIILGAISVAGMVGSGGIGTVALNYGYKIFNKEVMYTCIIAMTVLVVLIQLCGNLLYRKLK